MFNAFVPAMVADDPVVVKPKQSEVPSIVHVPDELPSKMTLSLEEGALVCFVLPPEVVAQ